MCPVLPAPVLDRQVQSTGLAPCLTLRENTERPVAVTQGTNTVVGCDLARIVTEALTILDGKGKAGRVPELWGGQAAKRIVQTLWKGDQLV